MGIGYLFQKKAPNKTHGKLYPPPQDSILSSFAHLFS